jgi:hypothetical protein
LEKTGFEYGFNSNYLINDIATYWSSKYDWRKQEKMLNGFNQFVTNIDGLQIHFLHIKPQDSKGKKVLPLLLVHGWPGNRNFAIITNKYHSVCFFLFLRFICRVYQDHPNADQTKSRQRFRF